jgi:hypothetical protein
MHKSMPLAEGSRNESRLDPPAFRSISGSGRREPSDLERAQRAIDTLPMPLPVGQRQLIRLFFSRRACQTAIVIRDGGTLLKVFTLVLIQTRDEGRDARIEGGSALIRRMVIEGVAS